MMYYHLVVYFLVVIWIQDGVAQTDYVSIWSNTNGSISPGDSYTISCRSQYTFWFHKNTSNPKYVARQGCSFADGISKKEYDCEHEKIGNFYHANLTIKRERSPTTVEWKCYFTIDRKTTRSSKPIHIEIRRDDPLPTTRQRTTPPPPRRTTPRTSSTRTSSSSSSNKPSPTNTPVGQPPDTTPSGTSTIILIAICCAVGVLILLITIFAVMFLHNKRKQKRTKRGPIRPVSNRPSAAAAAAIGTYDIVDDTSPPRNDFGDDFGNTYDTAHSFAPPTSRITDPNYDTTEGDAPQASTNPNFDPSKVYGVVNKKDPVADTKDSYGEAEAGVNNPNFDPDKVYGVVNKSAKCQNPVSESTTENIYVNQ